MIGLDQFTLDKNTPIPLYYQLKQCVLKLVEEGKLQVGDMLPTESELCEQLHISRPTIRQALSELVNEGYLTRKKGKGTFVSSPKIDARFLKKLESFNQEMEQKGFTPSTRVLELQKIEGTKDACKALKLSEAAPLIHLKRLRFANEDPVVCIDTYLPFDRYPALMDADFTHLSLYERIEALYAERVERVYREIEAVGATRREGELLDMEPGRPICLVKTVGYIQSGEPVEYSVARYRGDRNKFSVELYR